MNPYLKPCVNNEDSLFLSHLQSIFCEKNVYVKTNFPYFILFYLLVFGIGYKKEFLFVKLFQVPLSTVDPTPTPPTATAVSAEEAKIS